MRGTYPTSAQAATACSIHPVARALTKISTKPQVQICAFAPAANICTLVPLQAASGVMLVLQQICMHGISCTLPHVSSVKNSTGRLRITGGSMEREVITWL